MKVWLEGPEGLEPGEESPGALAADELRVEVEAVCLEPHELRQNAGVAPGGGLVGRVAECGQAATAFAGARVLVAPVAGCGECDTCRRGFAPVCPTRSILGRSQHGGCAESIVAKARWITRLDSGLDVEGPVAALLAGPVLTAYGLYARAGVSAGDLMIVLGRGPTAAALSTLARSRGVTTAMSHGAGAGEAVTSELSAVDAKGRPQFIFVCDGDESFETGLALANPGSTIVVLESGSAPKQLAGFCNANLTLLGYSYAHPDLMTETAALVVKGELDIAPFARQQAIAKSAPSDAEAAFSDGQCLVLCH